LNAHTGVEESREHFADPPSPGHSFFQVNMVNPQQPDLIEHTMAFWSERTQQVFSREEARQMVANVVGFFQVLTEWQRNASEEDQNSKKRKHA
jgi:hypothetical protein